ncbi:MAG TPA: hypothetical protein VN766_18430 [Stellaceae bacterium]|nr:hypothetical protein [Stellaceae bacterium]
MSSCGSYSHSYSYSGICAPSSHASAQCQQEYQSYECHRDSLSCSYKTHHDCHQPPPTVDVLTLANQLAAAMGAGVQGTLGCTVDPDPAVIAALTPTDPDGLLSLGNVSDTTHVLGNADFNDIELGVGDGNTLVVGDGATDQININTGDNNVLWAGNGAGDMLTVGTGDNNALHAGNGDGDWAIVFTGDNNCVTVGDGDGDVAAISSGNSNEVTAGSGANDFVGFDTGDNNLLTAGDGAGDQLMGGTGDHNTLAAGNGDGDTLSIDTGDYNFLHAGNGAGDSAHIGDGDFNALIVGNGNGDVVIVEQGSNNVLAEGNGNGDILQLGDGGLTSNTTMGQTGGGDDNILLQGNGANDFIFLGGANFDSVTGGHLGQSVNAGNVVIMGNGNGDQAWGSLGDHNSYLTGAGNDLVHTGGGQDFVYVDNHTETSDPQDPFHLTTTDSLAQNLFADGGNDTFAIQGAQINTSHYCGSYSVGNCYSNAVTFHCGTQSYGCDSNGDVTPLGTTVMTGGGGVENYWVAGAFGNAVITDFNSANGDRVMVGGVWDGTNSTLSSLGPIHTQYIHSAYDTANTGNVDLLITFGSNSATQGSITLIDFLPQDTGGTGGAEQFNNVTFSNPVAAESTLAHIFDFSQADNQAVTNQVASLAAANLILH